MHTMIVLIPLLPLAGFVVTLLLGKRVLSARPEVVSLAAVTTPVMLWTTSRLPAAT